MGFVDYLWGIETHLSSMWEVAGRLFVDYLWGIETLQPRRQSRQFGQVCRLPMRDWNYFSAIMNGRSSRMFVDYLWGIETSTDKSLKAEPWEFVDYLWGIETEIWMDGSRERIGVCRLPMRDWNYFSPALILFRAKFVDYLWGIETQIPWTPSSSFAGPFVDYLWGIETR